MDEKGARELLAGLTIEEKERLFALLMGLKVGRESKDLQEKEKD